MTKWIKDGLIGWATVLVVGVVVSVGTRAPYSFISSLLYMLGVGLFGVPGGIILGRKRDKWIWPAMGGLISAAIIYYALAAIFGYF
jgi:ABC-type dipeptide/oligopeptide/nickel transport system permease component